MAAVTATKPEVIEIVWKCSRCPQQFRMPAEQVQHSRPLRTGQHASEAVLTISVKEEALLDRVALHMKECPS